MEVWHALTFYQGTLELIPPNLWVDSADTTCPICATDVSTKLGRLRQNKMQHQLYHLTLKTLIAGDAH